MADAQLAAEERRSAWSARTIWARTSSTNAVCSSCSSSAFSIWRCGGWTAACARRRPLSAGDRCRSRDLRPASRHRAVSGVLRRIGAGLPSPHHALHIPTPVRQAPRLPRGMELTCDIVVENAVMELCGGRFGSELDDARREAVGEIRMLAGKIVPARCTRCCATWCEPPTGRAIAAWGKRPLRLARAVRARRSRSVACVRPRRAGRRSERLSGRFGRRRPASR